VPASSARQLRPALKAALRDGLAERGLTTDRRAEKFIGDESWAQPPLTFLWWMPIEANRYGGLRFHGHAELLVPEIDRQLAEFPADSLSPVLAQKRAEEDPATSVAFVTSGRLLDARGNWHEWVVEDESHLAEAIAEFLAVVDGPLRRWAEARRDAPAVLAGVGTVTADSAQHNMMVRSLVLLALREGQPDTARSLVAGYRPNGGDTAERFAAFERELARRYPAYGSAQLTSP
jgi:hypothetical protein